MDMFVCHKTQLALKPLDGAVVGSFPQISKIVLIVDGLVNFQKVFIEEFLSTLRAVTLQVVAFNLMGPSLFQRLMNIIHVGHHLVKRVEVFVTKFTLVILRLLVITFCLHLIKTFSEVKPRV